MKSMIYIPSFVRIGLAIQNCLWRGDHINLLSFLQNKESRLSSIKGCSNGVHIVSTCYLPLTLVQCINEFSVAKLIACQTIQSRELLFLVLHLLNKTCL
jgi:hypothetical protein